MKSFQITEDNITYYHTPNPQLLLRSDGILVPFDITIKEIKEPVEGDLKKILPIAIGHGLTALSNAAASDNGSNDWLADAFNISQDNRKIMKQVGDVIDLAGKISGYADFGIKALKVLGVLGEERDPLVDLLNAIDQKLNILIKVVEDTTYSIWAAERGVAMANLRGQAQSAMETVQDIIIHKLDPSSALTASRLGHADRDSRECIEKLIASGIEDGYWMRPFNANAIKLDDWKNSSDDRPPITETRLVWDYRIVLPFLCYALVARIMVLKVIYANEQYYCRELRRYYKFFLQLQEQMSKGIRRKLAISHGEDPNNIRHYKGYIPFTAGAVDVYSGIRHFIRIDSDALNLSSARGLYSGPIPPSVDILDPMQVANTITLLDIDHRYEDDYRTILQKQAQVSFTILRWQIGLQELCILTKNLGRICTGLHFRMPPISNIYDNAMASIAQHFDIPVDVSKSHLSVSRELTKLLYPKEQLSAPNAMRDLFLVYTAIEKETGQFLREIQDMTKQNIAKLAREIKKENVDCDSESI